jgi:hypothetical protein
VRERLAGLGARLEVFDHEIDEDGALDWARARAPLHAVVYDAAGALADGGVLATVDRGWVAIRAAANGALIPAQGGKVILLGPTPTAGKHAEAARAALENTARTLSVEWARYSITATMIAPGASTSESDLADLVAFLVSRAGDYYSGCRFDLGSVAGG